MILLKQKLHECTNRGWTYCIVELIVVGDIIIISIYKPSMMLLIVMEISCLETVVFVSSCNEWGY